MKHTYPCNTLNLHDLLKPMSICLTNFCCLSLLVYCYISYSCYIAKLLQALQQNNTVHNCMCPGYSLVSSHPPVPSNHQCWRHKLLMSLKFPPAPHIFFIHVHPLRLWDLLTGFSVPSPFSSLSSHGECSQKIPTI